MIVDLITELSIMDVHDRGIANKECISLRANEAVNLGQYGLMLGVKGRDGAAFPIRDNLLWFGDGWVKKGDWIFVYTGPGEARVTNVPNTGENLYSIHWMRKKTILDDPAFLPMLIRVDAVQVSEEAPALTEQLPHR